MSREKQIEEMAKYCCNACDFGNQIDLENNIIPCAIDKEHKSCPLALETAEMLYNAGYRKQSEGKWIKATPYSQEYCNQCGLTPKTIFGKLPPFCPNCGAKMKGGVNDDK